MLGRVGELEPCLSGMGETLTCSSLAAIGACSHASFCSPGNPSIHHGSANWCKNCLRRLIHHLVSQSPVNVQEESHKETGTVMSERNRVRGAMQKKRVNKPCLTTKHLQGVGRSSTLEE